MTTCPECGMDTVERWWEPTMHPRLEAKYSMALAGLDFTIDISVCTNDNCDHATVEVDI